MAAKEIIFAGPWIGEFGWELFCWQSYLRKIASQYDVIVSSRQDREYLYRDFCKEFFPFIVNGRPDAWKCRGFRQKELRAELWRSFSDCQIIKPQKMKGPQLHRKYGQANPALKYDYLIHARSRNHRKEANWSIKNWMKLVKRLKGRIASVGSSGQSFLVPGTKDLRGIELENLANICASSRLILGPSSGPLHFAALCGCPVLAWSGLHRSKRRYLRSWNPFQAPAYCYNDEGWTPSVEKVLQIVETMQL